MFHGENFGPPAVHPVNTWRSLSTYSLYSIPYTKDLPPDPFSQILSLHSSFPRRSSGPRVLPFFSFCLRRAQAMSRLWTGWGERDKGKKGEKRKRDRVKGSMCMKSCSTPKCWKDTCGQKCTTVWRARRSLASSCSGPPADFHPTENRKGRKRTGVEWQHLHSRQLNSISAAAARQQSDILSSRLYAKWRI